MAPCSSCGGNARRRTVTEVGSTISSVRQATSSGTLGNTANLPRDEDVIEVEDVSGKRGDRPVVGVITKRPYGHHQHGDRFLMFRDDVFIIDQRSGRVSLRQPGVFVPVVEREASPPPIERGDLPPPEPMVELPPVDIPDVTWPEWPQARDADELAEMEAVERPFDLQLLPGVGASRARQLAAAGLDTPDAILEAGVAGLKKAGLTAAVAAAIIEYLSSE